MAIVPTRPPLWRDVRVLRVAGQILFAVVVAVVLREIWLNLQYNYDRQGIDTSFDFLDSRAGFGIGEHVIDYSPNNDYWRAYFVGLTNTIFLIAIPGVLMASVLGLVMGVARLSTNWLVRKIAQVYVEVFRNTPVVVILVIMYVGVILPLPAIGGGFHIPGVGYLSNRGAAVSYVKPQDNFLAWLLFVAVGIVAWRVVSRRRRRIEEETGKETYPNLFGFGVFLLIAVAGMLALSGPIDIRTPSITERGFGYEGGLQASPELAAVVIGLVLYTGAFIAEIIRGSIQAVSKGQKEAAEALGLRPIQQLRFVVLPQALRIALPPINSQYLNLTKNSSLAVVIGFPDLAGISKTMINQSGRSFQVLLLILVTYLALSLVISTFMNAINKSITSKGARRG